MKELCLEATLDNLNTVNAFVEGELEIAECPPRAAMKVMVALEELYVNIASYAYGDQTGNVTVQVDAQPGKVRIRLADHGIAYDPLQKEDPDTTLSADERPVGGLGIWMVKTSMDVFTYERSNDQNIVVIEKQW